MIEHPSTMSLEAYARWASRALNRLSGLPRVHGWPTPDNGHMARPADLRHAHQGAREVREMPC
jgi:hypothetical protein